MEDQYQPMTPAAIVGLRTDLGWTQATFAQYFRVTPRTVWYWEKGEGSPSPLDAALMQQLRRRLDEARQNNVQDQFQNGLREQLPAILFGIGMIALLVFLFEDEQHSSSKKRQKD